MVAEAATGVSREDYIDNVANDILEKLPTDFDIDKTRKKFGSNITPTSVVLLQELERFNYLLSRMTKSLLTLRKVRCLFIARQRSHADARYWYRNSVCPSVRPSVTLRYCINGLAYHHTFFKKYRSPIILVFHQ